MDTFQNLASHELVVVASQRFAQVVRSSFTQTLVGRGALVPVGEGFISQVQPGLKFGDKSPPPRTEGSFCPGWYYELRLKGVRQHLRPRFSFFCFSI
jgi:hypothetical protein